MHRIGHLDTPFGYEHGDWTHNQFWSCAGRCTIRCAVQFTTCASLVFVTCEAIEIGWLIGLVLGSSQLDDTGPLRTKVLVCSTVILSGLLFRMLALCFWALLARDRNSRSLGATVACSGLTVIGILLLLLLGLAIEFAGFRVTLKDLVGEELERQRLLVSPISRLAIGALVTGCVDAVFSLSYAAFVAQFFLTHPSRGEVPKHARQNSRNAQVL